MNQDELFLSLLDVPVRVPTATPDGDAQAIDWATHGPLAGNHGHKPGLAALALAAGAGGLAAVRGQRERVLDHLVIDLQRGREYWRVLKDVRGYRALESAHYRAAAYCGANGLHARPPPRFIPSQRLADIIGSAKRLGQRYGVLDSHGSAVRQERREGVCGVPDYNRAVLEIRRCAYLMHRDEDDPSGVLLLDQRPDVPVELRRQFLETTKPLVSRQLWYMCVVRQQEGIHQARRDRETAERAAISGAEPEHRRGVRRVHDRPERAE